MSSSGIMCVWYIGGCPKYNVAYLEYTESCHRVYWGGGGGGRVFSTLWGAIWSRPRAISKLGAIMMSSGEGAIVILFGGLS